MKMRVEDLVSDEEFEDMLTHAIIDDDDCFAVIINLIRNDRKFKKEMVKLCIKDLKER